MTLAPTKQYTVIAPGRVNIIGEHVDHQNYPVLPCAITRSTTVKVSVWESDSEEYAKRPALEILHENSKYESVSFATIQDIKITEHKWYDYVVAAYFGANEYLTNGNVATSVGMGIEKSQGMSTEMIEKAVAVGAPLTKKWCLVVDGNVPIAAGLSSSSSLTVACTLALDLGLPADVTADLCANAERYSGTAGGGMDQAAICFAEQDTAQFINFAPLTHQTIEIPSCVEIVVANTCRLAPKAVSFAKMYNKRVFELKCAVYTIFKHHGIEIEASKILDKETALRDALRSLNISEEDMLANLPKYFKDTYSKNEIEGSIPRPVLDFILQKRVGVEVWDQNEEFFLAQRIRHVLTENKRVREFVDICSNCTNEEKNSPDVLKKLGELLNGSHYSLDSDFDCSCDELNELTQICRDAGAIGSRLTGAGWGGCTVSLVMREDVPAFLKTVGEKYFAPYINGDKVATPALEVLPTSINALDDVLFATKSGPSARVIV